LKYEGDVQKQDCDKCGTLTVINRCEAHTSIDVCYPEHLKNFHLYNNNSDWSKSSDEPDDKDQQRPQNSKVLVTK